MPNETGNGREAGITLQKLLEDLKVVVQDSEELLKTGAGQLRERAIAGAKVTDARIRGNPYPSMGIVFGLGLLLGVLTCNLITSGTRQMQEEND